VQNTRLTKLDDLERQRIAKEAVRMEQQRLMQLRIANDERMRKQLQEVEEGCRETQKAADRLDRLKRKIEVEHVGLPALTQENSQLRAEVTRLKAAAKEKDHLLLACGNSGETREQEHETMVIDKEKAHREKRRSLSEERNLAEWEQKEAEAKLQQAEAKLQHFRCMDKQHQSQRLAKVQAKGKLAMETEVAQILDELDGMATAVVERRC